MIKPITHIITLSILFYHTSSISFRLFKNRQACISVPSPNTYDFEYFVSGENEESVSCRIEDGPNNILYQINNKSHEERIIKIETQEGRICFNSMDNMMKVVSFDLVALNDPMRSQILQKDLNQLYNSMDSLYRSMEKLYRNQHFFYQRNRTHKKILDDLQSDLKYMKGCKIALLVASGIVQFLFIKKIIDNKMPKRKNKRQIVMSQKNQYKSISQNN